MAKFAQKIDARKMRQEGKSIKYIAETLGVSKSSASMWCSDIQLTTQQIENLRKSMIAGTYAGRMKGANLNKQRRLDRIEFWKQSAAKTIGKIQARDLLFAGIGLYLGEGSKKQRRFQFTNSDPELINACIEWLSLFNVSRGDLHCRIFINEMHKDRISKVTKEWSRLTGIPMQNFKNPIFIKSKLKKIYANHDSYLGVLALGAFKSSELFYRILGLLDIFRYNLSGKSQGSLMVKASHS